MDLLLVSLGGLLTLAGGFVVARIGASAVTQQSEKQLEHELRRVTDADLRAFQEAVIDLIEAIQLEYAHAATTGLANLHDWLPVDSYGALVRVDMLVTRVPTRNVLVTWEYLRHDIDERRKELLTVLGAFNSPLRDALLSDEAKPLMEQKANEVFDQNLFALRETIEKHRRLGDELGIAYRDLAKPSTGKEPGAR